MAAPPCSAKHQQRAANDCEGDNRRFRCRRARNSGNDRSCRSVVVCVEIPSARTVQPVITQAASDLAGRGIGEGKLRRVAADQVAECDAECKICRHQKPGQQIRSAIGIQI